MRVTTGDSHNRQQIKGAIDTTFVIGEKWLFSECCDINKSSGEKVDFFESVYKIEEAKQFSPNDLKVNANV